MAAEDTLTMRMRVKGARSVTGDVDQAAKAVKGLGKSTEGAAKRTGAFNRATGMLTKPLHHLRGEVGGLAKSFIGMGIAFGSVEGIKKSIETTDELVKTTVQLHHQFGLTTEAASGLAGVMQTRGLNQMGLRMGLTTLAKQMQAMAGGNDKAAAAFASLGITADQVRAGLASPDGLEKMFERVTAGMTDMEGGAQKAVTVQVLLGRASRSLAPLLQEGALGLSQQLKWAKEYGVTLDGHTVGSVEDMAAAQTKAQYAALGLQIQLGQFLAPALTEVNTVFADVIKSFRDGKPHGDKYARTIEKIGRDLLPLGKDLKDVGKYLADHPKLLRAAAIGFVAYKTKLLSLLTLAPRMYLQGLFAGRAYSRGIAKGMAEGDAAKFAAQGWFGRFSTTAGGMLSTWIPPVVTAVVAVEFAYHINNALAKLLNIPSSGTSDNTFNRITNPGGFNSTKKLLGLGGGHDTKSYSGQILTAGGRPTHQTGIATDDKAGNLVIQSVTGRGPARRGEHVIVGGTGDPHPGALYPAGKHWQPPKLEVVIHHTTVLDGKPIAKSTHREAVKAKSKR